MLKILTRLWAVVVILQVVSAHHHHNQHHHKQQLIDYCELNCPLFDPPHGAILLPGPTKSHFYKCNFGVGILFRCKRRTHFNPKKRRCEKPKRANAVECRGSPDFIIEGSGDDGFDLIRL